MTTHLNWSRRWSRVVTSSITWIVILISQIMLLGCASNPMVENANFPFNVVRATVDGRMPRGVRTSSSNGRKVSSNYFLPPGRFEEDGTEAAERCFANFTILGTTRPYKVEVEVRCERRIQAGRYEYVGRDKAIAQELARRLQKDIANRREDRNLIDDFRVF